MRSNELSYMSFARRCALVAGATFTLAACGGGERGNAGAEGEGAAASATAGGALADSITSGGAGAPVAGTPAAGDTGAGAMGAAGAMSDANILSMISLSNGAEIATSKAAQNNLTNANAKAFASDMIKSHQQMQGQVDQLVTRLNITPQAPPTAEAMQKMIDSATTALNSARGAAVDTQYMSFQVQAHQRTLNDLQRFETMAQNAEVRALVQKSIPIVREHLQRAQEIQGKMSAA